MSEERSRLIREACFSILEAVHDAIGEGNPTEITRKKLRRALETGREKLKKLHITPDIHQSRTMQDFKDPVVVSENLASQLMDLTNSGIDYFMSARVRLIEHSDPDMSRAAKKGLGEPDAFVFSQPGQNLSPKLQRLLASVIALKYIARGFDFSTLDLPE